MALEREISPWGASLIRLAFVFACVLAPGVHIAPLGPDHAAAQQLPATGTPLTRTDLEAWLDGFLPYALHQGNIAGAVVLVVKDGQILLQKGYGHADVAKRTPMDPERTILGVGSVSKTFTWTAVMQQVELGKLDLDRDINQYLDFEIPPAFGRPITLRHLMTHSAGFEERQFRQLETGAHPRALREYLQNTPVSTRIYPPGEVAAYSNYGSMLAGYIVERVSGESFVDYIDRHILQPLGMTRSSFRRPVPDSLAAHLAPSYDVASEPPLPPENEEPAGDPSGHLVTTASDISRFMLAHLQQGRQGEVQLLRPETTQLMHSPAFIPLPGAPGTTLGFFRTDYNGHRIIAHAGDIAGYHADLELLPDTGVGFFLALNSNGEGALLGAAHQLRFALFHRFLDRYFPARPAADEPTAPTAVEHARLVAGEYWMSRRPAGDFLELTDLITRFVLKLEIKANPDGTIETPALLDFEGGRRQRWREVGPFQWREVGGRGQLDMKIEDGLVKAWLPRDLFSFVLEPVPRFKSIMHLPLLGLSAAVLVLFTLLGPLSALRARRSGRRVELPRREARALRLTRWAALLGVLFLLGWMVLLSADIASRVGGELWIRVVQLIGLIAVAGTIAALWSAWVTIQGRRGWGAGIQSIVVALALVYLIWFSFAFKLFSISLIY